MIKLEIKIQPWLGRNPNVVDRVRVQVLQHKLRRIRALQRLVVGEFLKVEEPISRRDFVQDSELLYVGGYIVSNVELQGVELSDQEL